MKKCCNINALNSLQPNTDYLTTFNRSNAKNTERKVELTSEICRV